MTPEMETQVATCIKLEKRLCGALMRQWAPSGFSLETLVNDAANEIERLRRALSGIEVALARDEDIPGAMKFLLSTKR